MTPDSDHGPFQQSLAHLDPQVIGQLVVEPVVAKSHGQRHLPDIQKMARIPVLERHHGLQIQHSPVQILRLASHPVGVGAGAYAPESLPGTVQQTLARRIQLIYYFCPGVHRLVGYGHKLGVKLPESHIGRGFLRHFSFKPVEIRCVHQQSRMTHIPENRDVRHSSGISLRRLRLFDEATGGAVVESSLRPCRRRTLADIARSAADHHKECRSGCQNRSTSHNAFLSDEYDNRTDNTTV